MTRWDSTPPGPLGVLKLTLESPTGRLYDARHIISFCLTKQILGILLLIEIQMCQKFTSGGLFLFQSDLAAKPAVNVFDFEVEQHQWMLDRIVSPPQVSIA